MSATDRTTGKCNIRGDDLSTFGSSWVKNRCWGVCHSGRKWFREYCEESFLISPCLGKEEMFEGGGGAGAQRAGVESRAVDGISNYTAELQRRTRRHASAQEAPLHRALTKCFISIRREPEIWTRCQPNPSLCFSLKLTSKTVWCYCTDSGSTVDCE